MLHIFLEQLFELAAKTIPEEQILAAKQTYQLETGTLYEDDKSYNSRMALFLEWYLCDNYAPKSSKTVLEGLLENNSEECNSEKLTFYKLVYLILLTAIALIQIFKITLTRIRV